MNATAKRLTVEAGKYAGKVAGDTLPRREVRLQAEANGYTEREAHAMLEGMGQEIEIPEQGNLFGSLWPDNSSLITPPDRTVVDSFGQWLDGKRKGGVEPREGDDGRMYPVWHNPEHNWTHYRARRNFARAKDCDRYFWASYDEFSTVLVTRTADENSRPLVEQTEALSPKAYYQSRYRLLKRLSDDYACVEVRAPKYPTHAERTVRSHVHTGIWLPGCVDRETFDLLERKHLATVEGATDCHISVMHHSSEAYPCAQNGIDSDRGATTALPYELAGENQPLMNADRDALDLHDTRALEWMAALSAGEDGAHDTPGMSYWVELGGFSEYAEAMADSREDSEDSITPPIGTVGPPELDSPEGYPPESYPSDEREPSPRTTVNEAFIEAAAQFAQMDLPGSPWSPISRTLSRPKSAG